MRSCLDTLRHSYNRSMRANSPAPHLHYVGARKHSEYCVFISSKDTFLSSKIGHSSSVLSAKPLSTPPPRSHSRHKRHSSSTSSSSRTGSHSDHRRISSSLSITSTLHGHKRHLSETFKALLGSESHGHRPKTVSSPRKLGHRKRSSADSFFVIVQSPMNISPRDHSGPLEASSSDNRSFQYPLPSTSVPSFDLQSLGYALPSTPYVAHTTPSPPHNSYANSSVFLPLSESDPWSQPPHPLSERIHVHSELLSNSGHTLQWNIMLPPQTVLSGFNDPFFAIYSPSSSTKELLRSPACPGAAKIIIRPAASDPVLALWMEQWGPIEVYASDKTFEMEITVHQVLQCLYSYFQERLSSQATIEMPVESKHRIAHARTERVVFEGQRAEHMEWDKPPKRVDVLALWSVFGGLDVRYNHANHAKLDEPSWRVVELELRLRDA